jgi:UDP-N-acetylglucosamine--N-acetylmuramyl-(pentapeptide) pyrophosphoryl-undecaprenol N-acetylglucosamine transferase
MPNKIFNISVVLKNKLSILFYAINGTGLGHISRLNNVATDASYICHMLNIIPNFEFITTSDAPSLVKDFLVTKYPSKTTMIDLGLPLKQTSAKIKAQIINHINGFSPDCLVLDTNPKGSYNEFPILRDFSRTSVFIDRARKKESITTSVKKHIKLFDSLIVPESPEQTASLSFHPNIYHSNKIHGFKPENNLSRNAARNAFGVQNENLIYISSGGGGDETSQKHLEHLIKTALSADPTAKVLVGYGSLYKGPICYSEPRVIPYVSNDVNQYFNGLDYAISAAGYNTFEELKAAKCPTLFYSLDKGMDDQLERINQSAQLGLCSYADKTINSSIINEFRLSINAIKGALQNVPFEHGSAYAAGILIKTALSKRGIEIHPSLVDLEVSKLISKRDLALSTPLQKLA